MTKINKYLEAEISRLEQHVETLKQKINIEEYNQELQEQIWQTEDMVVMYREDLGECI